MRALIDMDTLCDVYGCFRLFLASFVSLCPCIVTEDVPKWNETLLILIWDSLSNIDTTRASFGEMSTTVTNIQLWLARDFRFVEPRIIKVLSTESLRPNKIDANDRKKSPKNLKQIA